MVDKIVRKRGGEKGTRGRRKEKETMGGGRKRRVTERLFDFANLTTMMKESTVKEKVHFLNGKTNEVNWT